jgi:aminopeptidase N
MPYSEGTSASSPRLRDEPKIDVVTYVTAHEIGHQWWAHQVIGPDQQGGTLLSETLAQYSALLVMERLYGKEQMRRFLKYELDRYLRSRGGEVVEELPLARVENQQYIHYQKGSLVLYWLKRSGSARTRSTAPCAALLANSSPSRARPIRTRWIWSLRPARRGPGRQAGPDHRPVREDHPAMT